MRTDPATLPEIPEVAESVGERMVYIVRSDNAKTPRKTYRVDLTANSGAGECACKDWGTRRLKAIRAGELTLTRKTTCKHFRKALAHFCRGLLRAMAESERA